MSETVSNQDLKVVRPFIQSVIEVLRIQCSFSTESGKPFLKDEGPKYQTDIAAVIGLVSKSFNGSVAICFPEKIFLTLMSNMVGEECTQMSRELEDGAAELLNIIFGRAKTILNESGFTIQKAIPTIVRGHSLAVRHLTQAVTIVIPFKTNMGDFHIEVAFEQFAASEGSGEE